MKSAGDFATHYYRADRRPFASLSDVADADIYQALVGLEIGSRRRFGQHYINLRRATETAAREAFIGLGGRPERLHPHYFVLGESAWFAGLYDEPREVRIPLTDLPPATTSFTWTDSIAALGLGLHLGVPQPVVEEDRHLYRLDQLDLAAAKARVGMTQPEPYEGYQSRLLDQYVELQLWSDRPIERYR